MSQSLTRFSLAAVVLLTLAVPSRSIAQDAELEPCAPLRDFLENIDAEEELADFSNTGYIDSAIVRNLFRIRYDSSVNSDDPDRAEFIYGKCLCFGAFGQDAASPGPGSLDFEEFELSLEHAFNRRFSVLLEIPFRRTDLTLTPGFEQAFGAPVLQESGFGDVRAGFKYAFIADKNRYLTGQLRGYLATGDAAKNLGTDHASIEPALLYFNQISKRWALESEARWWHPLSGSSDPITGASIPNADVGRIEQIPPFFVGGPAAGPDAPVRNDGFAGDILRLGIGASREGFGNRVKVSPVVELVGWYVLDGFKTPGDGGRALPPFPIDPATDLPFVGAFIEEADGDTIVNLKLGARIRSDRPGSFYVGYGFALTDEVLYESIFRLEYNLSFARRGRPPCSPDDEAGSAAVEVSLFGSEHGEASSTPEPRDAPGVVEGQETAGPETETENTGDTLAAVETPGSPGRADSEPTLGGPAASAAVSEHQEVPASAQTAPTPLPGAGVTIYELQLGFYYGVADAQAFVDDLDSRGLSTYIVGVRNSQGESRYTVRIGPYGSMAEALRAGEELRDREGLDNFVRFRRKSDRA